MVVQKSTSMRYGSLLLIILLFSCGVKKIDEAMGRSILKKIHREGAKQGLSCIDSWSSLKLHQKIIAEQKIAEAQGYLFLRSEPGSKAYNEILAECIGTAKIIKPLNNQKKKSKRRR